MFYKKGLIPKSTIRDERTENSSTVEEFQPRCVPLFLELFESSKTNFEAEKLNATKQNFLDIVNLIEKGGLLCINENTLIQYTIDLIGILENLQSHPNQEITIFYGLRIIHQFFYIKTSLMEHIILNGYLPFFLNLIHSPEKHIKEVSTYICVLFFTSDELVSIALSSSLFSDFCDTFLFYLEDPKKNYPILRVISNAFNNITKQIYEDENVTLEMIERVMELYSISIKDNFETNLIICFIEFIQILNQKMDNSIIPLFFKYNVPFEFYQIIFNSQSFVNSGLYFFSFLTAYISQEEYLLIKDFFDFEAFLNLLVGSKQSPSFKQAYAFLIIENSLKYDIDLLNKVVSDQFLAFIVKCINDAEFGIKYRAGCCLFSALNAATYVSIEIVQNLFSSEIMLIALDILESDEPDLINRSLDTLDFTMTRLFETVGREKMDFYSAFEEKFFLILEELQNSENEDIKMHAYKIQQKFFPSEQLQVDPSQEELVINLKDK